MRNTNQQKTATDFTGFGVKQVEIPDNKTVTLTSEKAWDTIVVIGQRGAKVILDIIVLHETAPTVMHLGDIGIDPTSTTERTVTLKTDAFTVCRAIGQGRLSLS